MFLKNRQLPLGHSWNCYQRTQLEPKPGAVTATQVFHAHLSRHPCHPGAALARMQVRNRAWYGAQSQVWDVGMWTTKPKTTPKMVSKYQLPMLGISVDISSAKSHTKTPGFDYADFHHFQIHCSPAATITISNYFPGATRLKHWFLYWRDRTVICCGCWGSHNRVEHPFMHFHG